MSASAARSKQGRADLPARQLEAGGRRGDRAPQDRRGRCRAWSSRRPISLAAEGKIQEARSAYQQAVDELETKQESDRRNPGTVRGRDIEKLQVAVEGRQGAIDAATAAKQAAEAQISDAAAGPEGQRRSRAGAGPGGSGQDRRPCRRERAGGAVHAAGRRHRQPVHAPGRGPDPGGRRARSACRPASGRSRRRS